MTKYIFLSISLLVLASFQTMTYADDRNDIIADRELILEGRLDPDRPVLERATSQSDLDSTIIEDNESSVRTDIDQDGLIQLDGGANVVVGNDNPVIFY